ncbi:hypothetical protein [Andreprevotia chitinilytica]|uniref:hypothetical protein n=1 Tax=Andreprevotia chitinilytica TaxID=396808 RepID=UPI0012EBBD7C|nr:hypothetical protein [Andreprevotia chitinilytica]
MAKPVTVNTAVDRPTTTIQYTPPKLKLIVIFVGGAADYDSFAGQGPTYIMGAQQRNYVREVQKKYPNTLFEGHFYDKEKDGVVSGSKNSDVSLPVKNRVKTIYCGYDQALKSTLEDIKITYATNGQNPGLIVVGHSLGGWKGAELVEKIMALEIKQGQTDLLITLDPVGERYFSPHRWIPALTAIPNLSEPNPVPKYWINVHTEGWFGTSEEKLTDNAVATAGARWTVKKADENLAAPKITHGDARALINLKTSKGFSAFQKLLKVTDSYLSGN